MDNLVALLQRGLQEESVLFEYVGQNSAKILSDWTYAFNSSNMGMLGSSTLALARVLQLENLPNETGTAISLKIVDNELRVIYRALTQARPALTLPALSLLQSVARFVPVELTTQFDFTLRIIPKLLASMPFREAFLKFYIQLIRSAPAHLRKDLLSTRNVFSAWIGKLGQENEPVIIRDTLDVFRETVLKDVTTFSKTTKMGIFNDWTLKNMVRLLGSLGASDPDLANDIASFLIMLLCDKHYGVRMAGEHTMAKSFLKIVKPWENTIQMDIVVKLLREMPELVLPHFDTLAPVYPLTPKVSMWWFSFSVLHIRIMKLNTPFISSDTDESSPPPPVSTVSKTLLPVTATKTALQQAVQFKDSKLVQFQAAQIVLLALQRLRQTVKDVYEQHKWDATELCDEILHNRLPDVHMFTKTVEPDLLLTAHLAIVREFCLLRPLNINLQLPLEAREVQGLSLVQAENLLEIQTVTSDQTKWWNPSKDGPSLFTQLLKFANFNLPLEDKCSQLLQYLVEPTQLFADIPTLAHPVDGLLLTLTGAHSDLVWSLLDQSVQRAVRTPYQYIDKVKSESVSPFAVALIEQYASFFAERDSDNVVKRLLHMFLRSLIVLGEDHDVLENYLSEFGLQGLSTSSALIMGDDFFNFVLDAPDNEILTRKDLVFKITNPLELSATLYRISQSNSVELQDYLLASIPEDMLDLLTFEAAYRRVLNGPKETLHSYLAILEDRTSPELARDLEQSVNWELGISRESSEFLKEQVLNTQDRRILQELNFRRIILPLSDIRCLLEVEGVAENLLLRSPNSVPVEDTKILTQFAVNAETVAALVTVSGMYDPRGRFADSAPVLTAAARFAPTTINRDTAMKTALDLIERGDRSGISIIAELKSQIIFTSQVWDSMAKFVEGGKTGLSKSVLLPEFSNLVDLDPPFLSRWLKIAVLQLTKCLAEHRMNADLLMFVVTFNELVLDKIDIWAHVHPNALNALLDATIRFSHESSLYDMASRIALQGENKPLEASGHLTSLLEKQSQNSVQEIVLIYALFCANREANSTLAIEQGILVRYSGTVKAKDQILLSILETIESYRQRSWVDNVQSWEIRPARANLALLADDYGADPLIVAKGSDLYVTLDEVRIKESVQRFEQHRTWHVAAHTGFHEIMQSVEKYDLQGPEDAERLYDSLFLLNTIVSCEYLLERPELFLTSGLLSFVICCFADEQLSDTAFRLLAHESKSIEQQKFKDQVGTSLAINKVLMLHEQRVEKGLGIPAYLAIIIGQLVQIIARPTHFLHEKVSGWLLEGPSVFETDIPLFKMIANSQSDSKPREMVWLVNTLMSGAVDKEAVNAYARQGVIEWCLSRAQIMSPKSAALRSAVSRFVRRIEELNDGPMTLASRFGALVIPELAEPVAVAAKPRQVLEWAK